MLVPHTGTVVGSHLLDVRRILRVWYKKLYSKDQVCFLFQSCHKNTKRHKKQNDNGGAAVAHISLKSEYKFKSACKPLYLYLLNTCVEGLEFGFTFGEANFDPTLLTQGKWVSFKSRGSLLLQQSNHDPLLVLSSSCMVRAYSKRGSSLNRQKNGASHDGMNTIVVMLLLSYFVTQFWKRKHIFSKFLKTY